MTSQCDYYFISVENKLPKGATISISKRLRLVHANSERSASFSSTTSLKQTLPIGGHSAPQLKIEMGVGKQRSLDLLFRLRSFPNFETFFSSPTFCQFKFSDSDSVDLATPLRQELCLLNPE